MTTGNYHKSYANVFVPTQRNNENNLDAAAINGICSDLTVWRQINMMGRDLLFSHPLENHNHVLYEYSLYITYGTYSGIF